MWSTVWWFHCLLTSSVHVSCNDDGPLLLTPYIDQNQTDTARQLSFVNGTDVLGVNIPLSYSGYITADKELGNHLFFWFFPSSSDKTQSPLVVWLNGGPGISSMLGLFHENGPLQMKEEGDNVVLEGRQIHWAQTFSMLYIDNPVGTGYSYSESLSTMFVQGPTEYTKDLYSFMEQFYQLFPEYMQRELYIGGQSYAGMYVPSLAHYIHEQIQCGRSQLPLTGIYLGGPYFDPETQNCASVDLPYTLGVFSPAEKNKLTQKCLQMSNDENRSKLENYLLSMNSFYWYGDNFVTEEKPPYDTVKRVMNEEQVKDAVHVGDLKFQAFSNHVRLRVRFHGGLSSTKSKLAELMDNYKVLIYTGEYDGIITASMVEAALSNTNWTGHAEYFESSRTKWTSEEDEIKGYYSRTGQFCRVVVHGAGHQTPYDQPETSLDMMQQFVQHGCIRDQLPDWISYFLK